MGASDYQLFRYVLVPAALPVILTGLRMGFTIALLSIIGSETIASLAGLGHHIVQLAEGMDMARMFAYIVFVVAIVESSTVRCYFSRPVAGGAWMSAETEAFLHRHRGVVRLGVIVLILLVWEIAARWFIDPLFISPPSRVFASLG